MRQMLRPVLGDHLDPVDRVFQDELAPVVEFRPSPLHAIEVDLPIDIHELQHVEHVDRAAAIGGGDEIGQRRGTGNPGIYLAQIDTPGIGVDQEIHAEGALVAFLVELVAELARHPEHGPALSLVAACENVVAAPAALVGRHLRKPGDIGLHRPHQRAVAGRHRLKRAWQMIDPAHDLELFLDQVLFVLLPVGLGFDEEGGAAGIAVGRLNHEVGRAALRRSFISSA
jgi:hypothetical protein